MRNFIYTNASGETLDFNQVFVIEAVEGLGSPLLDRQVQKAPYQHGVTVIDYRYQPREITFTLAIRATELNLEATRAEIVNKLRIDGHGVYNGRSIGTLAYSADGTNYNKRIDGTFESIVYSNRRYRDGFQRVLLKMYCENPFWYGSEISTTMEKIIEMPGGIFKDIAYDGEKYVACSLGGFVVSYNGKDWRIVENTTYHVSIAWNGTYFVAVGESNTCATSPDGITWTSRMIVGLHNAILWTGSQFVAVGYANCSTSPDGITWTQQTIPAGNYLSIAWNGSLLVAVGGNVLSTSPDGITWTARTGYSSIESITWNGSFFLIAGNSVYRKSTDGIDWSINGSMPSGSYRSIAWNGSLFVAVGGNVCATSPDGITWTARTISPGTYSVVKYYNSEYIAAGSYSASYSVNGIDWNRIATKPLNGNFYGININSNGIIAACGYTYENIAISINGAKWVYKNVSPAALLKAITSNGTDFVAVGIDSCCTSSDNGETWVSRTIPSGTYNAVVWGNGIYLASGSGASATSPDGITWTARTAPVQYISSVVWNGTYFVAVTNTTVAYTSPDGINWTSRTTPGNGNSVAWNGKTLVSVGSNTCSTSPDGITWTSRTIPTPGTYLGVTWNGSLFVAVGSNVCATSPDGITWTAKTIGTGNFYGITWTGTQLVAVGLGISKTSTDAETWSEATASDYVADITVTGDAETPIEATIPIYGGETGKIVTLSDGVVWTGTGTPPTKTTMAISTTDLQRDSIQIDTTFGKKSVKFLGYSIFDKFIGGYFYNLSPGAHYMNVRNSGTVSLTAPVIKYKPRYVGV